MNGDALAANHRMSAVVQGSCLCAQPGTQKRSFKHCTGLKYVGDVDTVR